MNVSFYKGTGTPKTLVEGGIYFQTDKKIISLGIKEASSTAVKLLDFGGNVTNAEWDASSSTLTITKSDGSSFSIEHIADAEAVFEQLKLRLGSVSAQTVANGGGAITVTETQGASSKSAVVGLKTDNTGNVKFSQSAAGLKGTVSIPVTNVKEGFDIDVSSESGAFTVKTALDADITSMGVALGALPNGGTLTKGMTLSEVLKALLIKEIDVTAINPTTTIKVSGVSSNYIYEVGTAISATLAHIYTDGKFTGQTGYTYNLAAGCTEGATVYKRNNTTVTSPDAFTITEGTHTWNCTTVYSPSTASPKKNNGKASSVNIAAGTATSGDFSIYGRYKAYIGYSTATTGAAFDSASIKALNAVSPVWVNTSGGTTIVPSEKTSNGTSIIIACPESYRLTAIANSLGVSIMDNFVGITKNSSGAYVDSDELVKVNYTNGGVTTKYKVYVYPITSGAKVAYKGVTISKA